MNNKFCRNFRVNEEKTDWVEVISAFGCALLLLGFAYICFRYMQAVDQQSLLDINNI